MNEKFLMFTIILTVMSMQFFQSFGESDTKYVLDLNDLDKTKCDMFAFEQPENIEEKKFVKKLLDACIAQGKIDSELVEVAQNIVGVSTRDLTNAYRFANGDLAETIKILQDPTFPKNIFDPVLKAYDDLNNRIAVDSEFAKLMETEVVGFGINELDNGIFIVVESTYANQENFDRYDDIFRETIGEDIPIKFESNERSKFLGVEEFDSRIFLIALPIPVVIAVIIFYFKKKK